MPSIRGLVAVWGAITVAFSGCRAPTPQIAQPAPVVAVAAPLARPATTRPQIAIDSSDAARARGAITIELPAAPVATVASAATPLSPTETAALLDSLPPLPDVTTARTPPVRPPTVAPPAATTTTPIVFVAPTGAPVPARPAGPRATIPLKPPTISPNAGYDVRGEAEIKLWFDEPMIAVAAIGATPTPPATITPAIAGDWRWLDTRVAVFTARSAFPGSTTFTVTVTGGLTAVSGATLATPTTGQFTTAPVRLAATFPAGYQVLRPDAPLALGFDQPIDPAAIAPFVVVETRQRKPIKVHPIARDAAIALWRQNPSLAIADLDALGANVLILAPDVPWAAGLAGHVALSIGAPSREGPRTTTAVSDAHFEVATPFTVVGLSCGEMATARLRGVTCPADEVVTVELTHPVDETSARASMIRLDGAPSSDRKPSGARVSLAIPARVGQTFTIAIDPALRDAFGQPYSGPTRLAFTTTAPHTSDARFAAHTSGLVILDPRFQIPQWVLEAEAVAKVEVELRKVEPKDYFAYLAWEDRDKKPAAKPPA
ncbi:MAG: Ig-like domain-containing protein [Proteobacteria bacterium]|nr:Ig-like domain-containing protein [Pseudomonadota bacterium]